MNRGSLSPTESAARSRCPAATTAITCTMAHEASGVNGAGGAPTDKELFEAMTGQPNSRPSMFPESGPCRLYVGGLHAAVKPDDLQRRFARVPGITIPNEEPPSDLIVHTLVLGQGAEVAEGDAVVLHYTGVLWNTERVFDSSWEREVPSTFTAASFAAPRDITRRHRSISRASCSKTSGWSAITASSCALAPCRSSPQASPGR